MFVSLESEDLLFIRLFEGPALWHESVVKDISILSLKAHRLNNLTQNCAPEVTAHDCFA